MHKSSWDGMATSERITFAKIIRTNASYCFVRSLRQIRPLLGFDRPGENEITIDLLVSPGHLL